MLILKPFIHETIWGSDLLSPLYDINSKKIGHLYSCNPEDNDSSIIINFPNKGIRLYDYLVQRGVKDTELTFVVALVTPGDKLSIQVHPSFGEHKKNESWYFIRKPNDSYIYNGCKLTRKEEIRSLLNTDAIEQIVDTLQVENGDYVYVPAGTLHAMTAGCMVYEIEELNGQTYRMFDYNRVDEDGNKRELQVDLCLENLDCEVKSTAQPMVGTKKEEKYEMELISGGMHKNNSGHYECLTLVDGISNIEDLKLGMSIILEPGEICDLGHGKFVLARSR